MNSRSDRTGAGPERSQSLDVVLSPRQREVLQLVARGLTNPEIGQVLGISGETVRTHVAAVLARLEVSNRTEAATVYLEWSATTERIARVLLRPAIAVLPLVALDADPRAADIAAGISHDLVVLFSRWCWFPVIASASTRGSRALACDAQALGERLGARFLVDAKLRSAGAVWRITACVADTANGHCLWAETYDFPRDALFEVQDEICQRIVAAAYPLLIASVHAGLAPDSQPVGLPAWELAHRAFSLHAARERAANARAQGEFAAALAREPTLVLAHYGLGLAAYDAILNQWGPESPALDRLAACAERCIELSPHMAEGHYLVGRYQQARGQHDLAVVSLQRAIGHNPSFASAQALLGQVLLITGQVDEGLLRMRQACRLGPGAFVAGLAAAQFVRGEYREALAAAEQAVAIKPRYPFALVLAIAAAWWMDEHERAADHGRALLTIAPAFSPSQFLRTFGPDDAVARIARALADVAARRGSARGTG
ncbi:LuxR C-terminal-related transcriptional regulator [Nannocystis bainbridge]|uniref:LuxR C-terminal-related transcriptional regulator n=1 Tax=Nannocystis bainbridge TaxID=2995303 RepID=A0ABT5E734_9BACT|nr:LuxR C-terminal-related transcriptional regulator [Nannocystis bainbridge]MDC0721673.1 LuxR C-terminal-related transcriptional regulator [Nannocystis bainbridge]